MSSTIAYLNAGADWRFVIEDIRGPDGAPYDLTGFAASVTFRPDADRATDIQDCNETDGGCIITPSNDPTKGPTISVLAQGAARMWRPGRPMLVVGDVMISKTTATPPTEDQVKRLVFVAMPGT